MELVEERPAGFDSHLAAQAQKIVDLTATIAGSPMIDVWCDHNTMPLDPGPTLHRTKEGVCTFCCDTCESRYFTSHVLNEHDDTALLATICVRCVRSFAAHDNDRPE